MTYLRTLLLALLITSASTALVAHPGHGKEISRENAIKRASAEVDRLVYEGKIEKTWALERRAADAARRTVDEDVQWLVTFDNPTATEARKRRLYVFLSASGDYIAANFSGK